MKIYMVSLLHRATINQSNVYNLISYTEISNFYYRIHTERQQTRTFADTIDDCVSWLTLVTCSASNACEAVTLAGNCITVSTNWTLWIAVTCETRTSNDIRIAIVTRCTPVHKSQVHLYTSLVPLQKRSTNGYDYLKHDELKQLTNRFTKKSQAVYKMAITKWTSGQSNLTKRLHHCCTWMEVPRHYNGLPLPPSKLPLPVGQIWSPSNT